MITYPSQLFSVSFSSSPEVIRARMLVKRLPGFDHQKSDMIAMAPQFNCSHCIHEMCLQAQQPDDEIRDVCEEEEETHHGRDVLGEILHLDVLESDVLEAPPDSAERE